MLKRTSSQSRQLSLVFVLLALPVFGADPAPANPPSTSDPAPASAPSSVAIDPAPASAPSSIASDPAPASAPSTVSKLTSDPAPAAAPGSIVGSNDVPSVSEVAPLFLSTPAAPKAGKAFLGVGFRDPNTTTVTTLWGKSTAESLGIQIGDSVISINGKPVGNLQQIRQLIGSMSVGDAATVTVVRGAESSLNLGPKPIGASYE